MSERFGLIGQPVKHSRSPRLHRAFGEQAGREVEFELIECTPDEVADTVQAFFAGGGRGLNVTLPHKGHALELCRRVSADARIARAVNTLVPEDDGLAGYNTDGRGLCRDLERLGIEVRGRRLAVIGAGGAARGILKPLLEAGPAELVWSNRSPWKVQDLEGHYAEFGPLRACTNIALKGDAFDLVINATAAGHNGAAPWLPPALFRPDAVAYDLTYGPAARPFLDWATRAGASSAHDGFGMLVEQAALSFELWTGFAPDTAPLYADPALRA